MTTQSLVTISDPTSATAEAYRTLRTNIDFLNIDSPLKTLLITAAGPEDQKDTALANLAVTMADGGRRVIVVDADLRRPQLHTLFGLNNTAGFTDMFRNADALQNPPLQSVPDTSLSLLASGELPPIPSQILGSMKLAEVLARLNELADMVLFTAPPLMAVTDAALLAAKVDGVLMVATANSTKRDHVKAVKERLSRVNANLVGAVLLNAPQDSGFKDYYK